MLRIIMPFFGAFISVRSSGGGHFYVSEIRGAEPLFDGPNRSSW